MIRANVVYLFVCCFFLPFTSEVKAQLIISFDYSFDGGFFSDTSRRTVLELAANELTLRINDTLSGISPSGANHWNRIFNRPDNNVSTSLTDTIIAPNTMVIYVGGRALGGSTLGFGGFGGFSWSGSVSWGNTVTSRGEPGAASSAVPKTDFAPWGGAISFDNDGSTTWFFDSTPATTADIPATQYDFYSVALHELGHVLGFAPATPDTSWESKIVSGNFTGTASVAEFGGLIPVHTSDNAHWASGTTSTAPGVGSQEAAMDPTITIGTRKYFTDLDFAGLSDIGWEISAVPVPEPGEIAMATGIGLFGFALLRRKRRAGRNRPSNIG